MQPHFFPWSGYFNLMSKVDKYVFLDDVQFSKSSWQSRNQILINGKKNWITIPTKKSKLKTNINEKLIDFTSNWQLKITKTIIQNYSKCTNFNDLKGLIDLFNTLKLSSLSEFNINIINFISDNLKIRVDFINSSTLNTKSSRTNKVVEILKILNAKEYISPQGAKDYLQNDEFNKITNTKLSINNYKCKSYIQTGVLEFIPNLSIIDLIANLGWKEASNYVKEN
jgi:hypothetical protein